MAPAKGPMTKEVLSWMLSRLAKTDCCIGSSVSILYLTAVVGERLKRSGLREIHLRDLKGSGWL